MSRLYAVLVVVVELGCGTQPPSADEDSNHDPRCTVCPAAWGAARSGCTDVRVDPWNCGACGNECAGGVCSHGECVQETCLGPCDGTTVCCNGVGCTNPNRDARNCGSCGHDCGRDSSCDLGTCVCGNGSTLCDGACRDTTTDEQNCGACGVVCGAGTAGCASGHCATCAELALADCSGTCRNLTYDANNCGACGVACGAGTVGCQIGQCAACTDVGLTDCSGTCRNVGYDSDNCGECGHACGTGEVCYLGACVSGTGSCAQACLNEQLCCAADGFHTAPYCASVRTDYFNCGECGNMCDSGLMCTWPGICLPLPPGGGD